MQRKNQSKKILKKKVCIEKAVKNYKELIKEMTPFLPTPKVREVSTEGEWQRAEVLTAY